METVTTTLTKFILARFAEDEAVAEDAQSTGDGWWHDGDGEVWSHAQLVSHPTMIGHAVHIARHDPARVLAECEAKRRIVEHATSWDATLRETPEGWTEATATAYRMAMHWTLAALALPYADHPAFQEEWRP